MNQGLITRIFDWGTHPSNSEGSIGFWLAGLLLLLMVAFLWSMVVRAIET